MCGCGQPGAMSSCMRLAWSTTRVGLPSTYPVNVDRIPAMVPAAMCPVGVSNEISAGMRSTVSWMSSTRTPRPSANWCSTGPQPKVRGLRNQFPLLEQGRTALVNLHESLAAGCSMSRIDDDHLTVIDAVAMSAMVNTLSDSAFRSTRRSASWRWHGETMPT